MSSSPDYQKRRVWLQFILAQAQIIGATMGLFLFIQRGADSATLTVVSCTLVLSLMSRTLFNQSSKRLSNAQLMKRCMSELLGTFTLVFAGTGAIIINQVTNGAISHVGIALTFGLVVLAMIYTFGEISGAHLNPAVTIAFWAARRFPGKLVFPYVLSQCLGASFASGILKELFPGNHTLGATLPAGSPGQSFVLELTLTFLLMLVILNVSTGAREKGITAGIVIGSVIGLEAMFAGPICGASMNPARSLSPALFSGHLEHLWIYLSAPTIGALLGILACCAVREPGCCTTSVLPDGAPQK